MRTVEKVLLTAGSGLFSLGVIQGGYAMTRPTAASAEAAPVVAERAPTDMIEPVENGPDMLFVTSLGELAAGATLGAAGLLTREKRIADLRLEPAARPLV